MTFDEVKKKFTPEENQELRTRAQTYIAADDSRTKASTARECGVAESTFHAWLSGSYNGDNNAVASKVNIWFEDQKRKNEAIQVLPDEVPFQETETAKTILEKIQLTRMMGDFFVVAGGPGIGKTTAIEHYDELTPNTWLVTAEPSNTRLGVFMEVLYMALGIAMKSTSIYHVSTAIKKFLDDRPDALIVIDEAQHLDKKTIEQLRSIHDKTGVAMVLVGNEVLLNKLEGGNKSRDFAQIFSRIGIRHKQAKARKTDINMLLDAWGITDREERKYMSAIASKPGALRGMTKCLRLATIFANGQKTARTKRHMEMAWSNLSSTI